MQTSVCPNCEFNFCNKFSARARAKNRARNLHETILSWLSGSGPGVEGKYVTREEIKIFNRGSDSARWKFHVGFELMGCETCDLQVGISSKLMRIKCKRPKCDFIKYIVVFFLSINVSLDWIYTCLNFTARC